MSDVSSSIFRTTALHDNVYSLYHQYRAVHGNTSREERALGTPSDSEAFDVKLH